MDPTKYLFSLDPSDFRTYSDNEDVFETVSLMCDNTILNNYFNSKYSQKKILKTYGPFIVTLPNYAEFYKQTNIITISCPTSTANRIFDALVVGIIEIFDQKIWKIRGTLSTGSGDSGYFYILKGLKFCPPSGQKFTGYYLNPN